MKILLIQPFGNESNTNYPPLGLLYLASFIREKSDSTVKVIDLRLKATPIEEMLPEITAWQPDIIGITGMSIEWSNIRHIAHTLRQSLGDKVTLVAGGPHATAFSSLVLENTPIDYIVKGEGEETFLHLVTTLEKGLDPRAVPGLVMRGENGAFHETAQRPLIANLDEIPFPAFDLIALEEYFVDPHFHNNLNKHNRILPILTARGCPLHCSFCYHLMGFPFRARSPENILREISWLVETYDIREFHIEDDIFNFKTDRAKETMQLIAGLGKKLAFAFPSGLKFELIDAELVELFRKAGVYRINLGIETAVPRIQKTVNKPIDLDSLDRVIDLINKAGISSHGFFMIGFPDETEAEIMATIDYATGSKLATANFSLVKIFPMTPLGDKYLGKVEFTDDFSFSYDSVTTNFSQVSDQKLKELEKRAYMKFFFRPGRIWRIFRTTPNKKNLFFRNIFTVLSLILRGKAKY